MADHYVDLSGDWEAAQTGADHVGNEWKGPYGLQVAGDTVAAGDTVYMTGTADMRRLCVLNLGKDIVAAGWVPGDTLKDNNTGLEWEGVYAENINTTSIVIELIAGDVYADITIGSGVNNITKADNTTITSKANTFQLSLNTTAGVVNNIIKYIGVNASWVNDGTRCMFDGHGTNGAAMYLLYANKNYCYFENMEFDDSDYRGFYAGGAYSVFINLYVHHCDDSGLYNTLGTNICYYKCVFKNNGVDGFVSNQHTLVFVGCVFASNSGNGFTINGGNCKIIGSISHNNSLHGINTGAAAQTFINNVLDGNNKGVYLTSANNFVLGCRATNNSDYGFSQKSAGYTLEFFNFLLNNTLGPYYEARTGRIEHVDGSLTAGVEGYNDRVNDDFNLTTEASLRRTEMVLPND